jgi:RNA polymerase sigma-70 factor (ECF subfamily)
MSDERAIRDEQLIKQACQGSLDAYGELYILYAPGVLRFLTAHMDDPLDAEDLTEEVFFRVWQALPGYRQQGVPFGGYLLRVARNALIDHYRRGERAKRLVLEEDPIDLNQPDPAEHLSARQDRTELQRMLGRLSDEHRMVLSLRFIAGLTHEETARTMQRSSGAVRVLQHRALAALRKMMEKIGQ